MVPLETALLNKVLCLLLDKHLYARVSDWQSSVWSCYLDLCRKQTYEFQVKKKYDDTIETIYVHSKSTATIVARFCLYNADVTELGMILGSPGGYEPVWDAWCGFVRKFYRIELSKVKPEFVTQKRKTLV